MPQKKPSPAGQVPEDTGSLPSEPTTTAPPSTEIPPPPLPPTSNRFFSWLRGLGLRREAGWIGGVCAGIAARLGIDPLIVRGIVVVLGILGGPVVLLYAAAWLLLPDYKDKIHLEQVFRGKLEAPVAGIGVLLLLALLPGGDGIGFFGWGFPHWGEFGGRAIWTLLVLGAIVAFVVWLVRRGANAAAGPTVSPATTDGRPETIPQPVPHTTTTGGMAAAPAAPATPMKDASAEELAAWREQQELWKAQNTAFRRQQLDEHQAALRAAQEVARLERQARNAEDRAQRARTRSNPLYSFVVIGLALVAGGVVALVGTASQNSGAVDVFSLFAGLTAALAVLAVGIIVNGIRGKRSGGASGVAIVLLVPILLGAIFPQSSNFRYGSAAFTPVATDTGETETYRVLSGDVTLDLSDYFEETPRTESDDWGGNGVTLLVGSGNITLLVPEDEYVNVTSWIASGWSKLDATVDYNGRDSVSIVPEGTTSPDDTERSLYVEVLLGTGTITLVEEKGSTD